MSSRRRPAPSIPPNPTTSVKPGNIRPDNASRINSGPAGKMEVHKQTKMAKAGLHGAKKG